MPGLNLKPEEKAWTAVIDPSKRASVPQKLAGPLVWSGLDDKDAEVRSTTTLTAEEVQQVEDAVKRFKKLGLQFKDLRRDTFPLSKDLADKIRNASASIHSGSGFAVMKGVDPRKYDDEMNMLIFAGIASYVGDYRYNMRHIYNKLHTAEKDEKLRPPQLPVGMGFHTDVNAGDILALYTQNKAKIGGVQRLASISTVYNELSETDPDVIDTLFQNWRFELPWTNGTEVINRPLMYYEHEKLMFTFAAAFVHGSDYDTRLPDGPPIETAERHAAEKVMELCHKHGVELEGARGDMLFVNNLAVLHQRDPYVDDIRTGQRRHLLSIMLRDPELAWWQPHELKLFTNSRFETADARNMATLAMWDNHVSDLTSPTNGSHD